jgi:hypothetical protein
MNIIQRTRRKKVITTIKQLKNNNFLEHLKRAFLLRTWQLSATYRTSDLDYEKNDSDQKKVIRT